MIAPASSVILSRSTLVFGTRVAVSRRWRLAFAPNASAAISLSLNLIAMLNVS